MIELKTIRQHIVVDDDLDDRLIEVYQDAAIEYVEQRTQRVIKQRDISLSFDSFAAIEAKTPLNSVASITYLDDLGAVQTVTPSTYQIKTGLRGCISLAPVSDWPRSSWPTQQITVSLNAGYSRQNLPKRLFVGILKKTLDYYENRGAHEFIKTDGIDAALDSIISEYIEDYI